MGAEQLITKHLDLWTNAIKPKAAVGRGSSSKIELYGIKKLRELILDLAVRGMLVPQDPNEEPANNILKNIEVVNAKLESEGVVKKHKTLPTLKTDEMPDLPKGWVCKRLGEIGLVGSSRRVHQKDWQTSGIPFYRAREIVKLSEQSLDSNELYISEELYEELSKKGEVPEPEDVMITGVGTIGVPYIVSREDKFYFKDASVLIFKNRYGLNSRYLNMFFKSPYWKDLIHKESMGTTVHTLTIARANLVPIFIPPDQEQIRIIDRVEELMSLCDQLEQQTEASISAHQTLVETLLNALTNDANHDAFWQAWQRIAQHFDTLFTTEYSIDQLKQIILQLAVMGKLVPQNSNDEPASELLKKIASEKTKLIKEGKIKKQEPLPIITDEEKLFELPDGWEWVRLNEILKENTQNGLSLKADEDLNGIPLLRISAGTIGDDFVVDEDQFKFTKNLRDGDQAKYCLESGDLLVVRFNGNKSFVGRMSIFENKKSRVQLYPDKLIRVRLHNEITNPYIVRYFFNSLQIRKLLEEYCATTVGNWGISASNVKSIPVPLPPLNEQKRIVEKLNEIISYCDQLKDQLSQAQTTQLHLADAIAKVSAP